MADADRSRSNSAGRRRIPKHGATAFGERAALLTPDPARRAQRMLAGAQAKYHAGALDAALGLLAAAGAGPPDALRAAQAEHLRGQIAADQQRGTTAARLLLGVARLLDPLNASLAREAHLEALVTALWAGHLDSPGGVREAAEAALTAPPAPGPPRAADVLLDALALRLTRGYAAAVPASPERSSCCSLWTPAPAKPAAGSGKASSPWSCGTSSPGKPSPPGRPGRPGHRRLRAPAVRAQPPGQGLIFWRASWPRRPTCSTRTS